MKTETWKKEFCEPLNKEIAIRQVDGKTLIDGKPVFFEKGDVMINDSKKTVFTWREWKKFKAFGLEERVYEAKAFFDAEIC